MRAAAILLAIAACGGGKDGAPSAPSAARIAIELVSTDAESSKDSHDTIERYRVAGGELHWETETKGYGEDEIPKRSGVVALTEQQIVRLADLCLSSKLTEDGVAEATGPLAGPGNTVTMEATITVDGATGRSRAVHQLPWNGPKTDEPPRYAALRALRDALATLRPPRP